MNEKNRFSIGDVTAELSEILDQAKNNWANIYSGLQNIVDTTKSTAERTVEDSKERVAPAIDTVNSLAVTAKKIGSTALSRILRKSSDIGDRPSSQE